MEGVVVDSSGSEISMQRKAFYHSCHVHRCNCFCLLICCRSILVEVWSGRGVPPGHHRGQSVGGGDEYSSGGRVNGSGH